MLAINKGAVHIAGKSSIDISFHNPYSQYLWPEAHYLKVETHYFLYCNYTSSPLISLISHAPEFEHAYFIPLSDITYKINQ